MSRSKLKGAGAQVVAEVTSIEHDGIHKHYLESESGFKKNIHNEASAKIALKHKYYRKHKNKVNAKEKDCSHKHEIAVIEIHKVGEDTSMVALANAKPIATAKKSAKSKLEVANASTAAEKVVSMRGGDGYNARRGKWEWLCCKCDTTNKITYEGEKGVCRGCKHKNEWCLECQDYELGKR